MFLRSLQTFLVFWAKLRRHLFLQRVEPVSVGAEPFATSKSSLHQVDGWERFLTSLCYALVSVEAAPSSSRLQLKEYVFETARLKRHDAASEAEAGFRFHFVYPEIKRAPAMTGRRCDLIEQPGRNAVVNSARPDKDDIEIVLVFLEELPSRRIGIHRLARKLTDARDKQRAENPNAAQKVSPDRIHPRAPISTV